MNEHDEPDGTSRMGRLIKRNGLFVLLCAIALLLLVGAYSNHFDNGFHFDDSHVIVNNLAIRSLHNAPSFFTDPHTHSSYSRNALYRPLLTLGYAWDYWRAGGLVPSAFHHTQFALLLLVGVTFVAFSRRLFDQAIPSAWNRYLALFGATLFCVHTANTQTVNYLSSRSSLVATLAVILAFWLLQASTRARRFHLYLIPIVIGGLAKPLTIMFAPIFFIYLLLFDEDSDPWAALLRSLPSFVVGGGLFVFLSSMNAETVQYAAVSRWHYLLSQPFVWLHYVRLYFLPVGLTADTDWKVVSDWYDTRVIGGTLFVMALVALTVWISTRRRLRPAAFGLAWFCLALLPTSSVMPLAEVYNEHRIFFPYVGLTVAVTWLGALGVRSLLQRRPTAARWATPVIGLVVLALLLTHAVGTFNRNRVWKNGETLWADVTQKSPANGRGRMNYGLTMMRRGLYAEALEQYEEASIYSPNYAHLEVNLGIVKAALGRSAEAEPHFLRAIELAPEFAGSHSFYARWLSDNGRGHEAIAQAERALELSPTDPATRNLLLKLYVASGNEDGLRTLARDTLALAPDDDLALAYSENRLPIAISGSSAKEHRLQGRIRIDQESWLDAAAILRHSLQLEEASAEAWNNLGWARLQLGFPDLAIDCFRRAFELDPTMQVARNNLAEAERRVAASN